MCEIVTGQEQTLDIPASLVKEKAGFAIDCGGSAMKVCYTTENGDSVRIHCFTYPRDRLEEGLLYLRDNVKGHIDPDTTYYTTGVGGSEYHDTIEKILGVKVKNRLEGDCITEGFVFLTKNFSLEELAHPESDVAKEHARKVVGQMMKTINKYKEKMETEGTLWETTATEPVRGDKMEFPVLVAQLGSAGAAFMVNEDGSLVALETYHQCGRYLMGVGSMLTRAKSFEDLVSLAERGNNSKVDIMAYQLNTSDDVYSNVGMDNLDLAIFPFGHCSGKEIEEFKREDLAAALIDGTAQSIVAYFHLWARLQKAKQVFFLGGLTNNSQFIRDQIAKYFLFKSSMNTQMFYTHPYFLKLGSYIGSLGALLKSLQHDPNSETCDTRL